MTRSEELIEKLKGAVHEGTLKRYKKTGEREPYLGVPMGAISKIVAEYKNEPEIFMDLFRSDILEAKIAAVQIGKPDKLTREEILECITPGESTIVADKFSDKILSPRKDREELKEILLQDESPVIRRYRWNLIIDDMKKKKFSSDKAGEILTTIEGKLGSAPEEEKWSMNHAMVMIALSYPEYLERILTKSREIGAYSEMKVSKGCTSPFAPEWINSVLKKQK